VSEALEDLPNIGKVLAHRLRTAGVTSPAQLLRLAWHYGFRHDGDQLFVRVSSNRSWDDISREPVLATLFARLQPLGL